MRIATVLTIGTAVLFMPHAAQAACALAGTWHFSAMQSNTPAIRSVAAQVRNATGTSSMTIKVFPDTGSPFNNETATAIQCKLTVAANGDFDGACTGYTANVTNPESPTVSGKFTKTAACNITGTVNVQGDPTPVTIRGGHINGVFGAGIATQGKGQVFHFTLIKN
jgi:hypothetical protein